MWTTRLRRTGGTRGHRAALHRTADAADGGLNHEYMAPTGGASGGPCGGLPENECQNSQTAELRQQADG